MIFLRHQKGLRLVALFEAAKGAIVLAVGVGLLSLVHKDAEAVAERMTRHLHLNPASHYPRIFIEAAGKLDDHRLWLFASLAFLYAVFRFFEAYGLWRTRRWAEWIALISGCGYLPFELYELAEKVTWVRFLALVVNLVIVTYITVVLITDRQASPFNQKAAVAHPLQR